VRLIDSPGRGHTILVAFNEPGAAAKTVSDITSAGMIPTVLEYLDGDSVKLANEYEKAEGIDNAAAVLLIETSDVNPEEQTALIDQACARNNCSYLRIESDPDRAETLWQVRRNVSKAAKELAVAKVSEDVAVPNSKFPDLVEFVARMNRDLSIRINSYGHAGDGNLHVNLLSSTGSEADLELIDRAVDKLMKKAVELGGTLSGEHGIGLAKREYMRLEFDEETLKAMQAFRDVLDPDRTLNPEKIFSSE
jgi:FAD/FMN-containing dehydrogenase